MRPVTCLKTLRVAAMRRDRRLKNLVDSFSLPVTAERDRVVAFVTIETLNLWASFARAYYLSCLLGAKRDTGQRVKVTVPSIRTTTDAIAFAMNLLKPKKTPPWGRRDEPSWHDPRNLLKLLTECGASNLIQAQAAFSYPTSVFRDLPVVRNFFAHRNEESVRKTADVARSLGVSATLRPSEILCSRLRSRPQNVLSDWLDDLSNVIESLCQ